MKNFKIFKKTKIFNQLIFEMTKLMKKIENNDNFRNSINVVLNHSIVNNRVDNMIKIMKKMIFNVNAFMNKIAQQQKH